MATVTTKKLTPVLMVEAIERETTFTEQYEVFLEDALTPEREIERTGR